IPNTRPHGLIPARDADVRVLYANQNVFDVPADTRLYQRHACADEGIAASDGRLVLGRRLRAGRLAPGRTSAGSRYADRPARGTGRLSGGTAEWRRGCIRTVSGRT